jgi:outer membrane protein assembly factor BamE (lipoprotein component of BamABCDE complex)
MKYFPIYLRVAYLSFLAIALFGCAVPQQRAQDDSNQLTVGKVQQTLKKGMKQDQVVISMGSPNLVTRDASGQETWIYDKLRTEVSTESSSVSGGIAGGGIAGASIFGGAVGASSNAASQIRSQKTLTVILKFKNQTLTDFSFNSTSF